MFYKIVEVKPIDNFILIVKFENGIEKQYDIKIMMNKFEVFKGLNNEILFKNVKIDAGGYGISWNENIDLSSEEIWNNGIEIK